MNTSTIIQAIKTNDSKKLYKSLYSLAFPPILHHIRQKRGNRTDAEDCFQEAILVLIKKVFDGSFNEKYEVKNFLFIAARNNWYNKLKRNGRINAMDIEEYSLEDLDADIETIVINKERQEAIQKLMKLVGEKCKQILTLMLFENKKIVEVMQIMDISSDEVVRTTHYRCKKKLKEIVGQDLELVSALRR